MNDYDELIMPSSSHLVSFDKQNFELFFTQLKNGSYEIKQNAFFECLRPSNEISRNSTLLTIRTEEALNTKLTKNNVVAADSRTRAHTALFPFSSYILTSSFDRFCEFFAEKSRDFQKKFNNQTAQNSSQACFYDYFHGTHNLSLYICIDLNNKDDMKYASHLCSINEKIVKPILDKNPYINQTNFGRFYSVSFFYGKSIHDTSDILTVATHSAVTQYASHERILPNLKELGEHFCTISCGYAAHFRPLPKLYLRDGRKVLNISDISFDLLFLMLYLL